MRFLVIATMYNGSRTSRVISALMRWPFVPTHLELDRRGISSGKPVSSRYRRTTGIMFHGEKV